jgi:uncharacterized repeat protein (TIGR01451 family)
MGPAIPQKEAYTVIASATGANSEVFNSKNAGTALRRNKSVAPSAKDRGILLYTLSVDNSGPTALGNLLLREVLPPEVEYMTWSATRTGHCAFASSTREFKCTLASLARSNNWQMTLKVKWIGGNRTTTNCATVGFATSPATYTIEACVTHGAAGKPLQVNGTSSLRSCL